MDACRGRCRVIVVNNSYQLAPWADVLWFCDRRWFEWHKEEPGFKEFRGLRLTLDRWVGEKHGVKCIENAGRDGLERRPWGVRTGRNGGHQAQNVAYHLAGPGSRQLLLGYDMRYVGGRSHWHGGHPTPTKESSYKNAMLPLFEIIGAELKAEGVQVINCTPGSAISCYPRMDIEAALQLP